MRSLRRSRSKTDAKSMKHHSPDPVTSSSASSKELYSQPVASNPGLLGVPPLQSPFVIGDPQSTAMKANSSTMHSSLLQGSSDYRSVSDTNEYGFATCEWVLTRPRIEQAVRAVTRARDRQSRRIASSADPTGNHRIAQTGGVSGPIMITLWRGLPIAWRLVWYPCGRSSTNTIAVGSSETIIEEPTRAVSAASSALDPPLTSLKSSKSSPLFGPSDPSALDQSTSMKSGDDIAIGERNRLELELYDCPDEFRSLGCVISIECPQLFLDFQVECEYHYLKKSPSLLTNHHMVTAMPLSSGSTSAAASGPLTAVSPTVSSSLASGMPGTRPPTVLARHSSVKSDADQGSSPLKIAGGVRAHGLSDCVFIEELLEFWSVEFRAYVRVKSACDQNGVLLLNQRVRPSEQGPSLVFDADRGGAPMDDRVLLSRMVDSGGLDTDGGLLRGVVKAPPSSGGVHSGSRVGPSRQNSVEYVDDEDDEVPDSEDVAVAAVAAPASGRPPILIPSESAQQDGMVPQPSAVSGEQPPLAEEEVFSVSTPVRSSGAHRLSAGLSYAEISGVGGIAAVLPSDDDEMKAAVDGDGALETQVSEAELSERDGHHTDVSSEEDNEDEYRLAGGEAAAQYLPPSEVAQSSAAAAPKESIEEEELGEPVAPVEMPVLPQDDEGDGLEREGEGS